VRVVKVLLKDKEVILLNRVLSEVQDIRERYENKRDSRPPSSVFQMNVTETLDFRVIQKKFGEAKARDCS
jgi:hypothetical protein